MLLVLKKETLLEDFYEVVDKIDAVPLPEAIYNAYRATFRTLKLDKKPMVVITPTDDAEGENNLLDNQDGRINYVYIKGISRKSG